jgi:chemotaxis signal transduction protein
VSASQLAQEYLVARVENMKFGIYCRDVKHVYTQQINVARLCGQASIFRGIVHIDGQTMTLIDLRRRIGVESAGATERHTLICFQTNMSATYAVLVDEILGMKVVHDAQITQQSSNLRNQHQNIHLLFPQVAILDDKSMIHLMDSTYVEKQNLWKRSVLAIWNSSS